MEVRGRRSRDMSPERMKICTLQPASARMISRPAFKRVQVVYYLSRNGQLEHPHYMEVTHLANQQLRLKDVIDRLIVLRGKGMPSMYSWSCKRSYKNGYVWNDLAENDIIYPSEGAEYILKGSEVIVDDCNGKFSQLQNGSNQQFHQMENFNFHPKGKPQTRQSETEAQEENDEDEDELQEEYEGKIRFSTYTSTTSTAPHPTRCSRGVSTDDGPDHHHRQTLKNPTTELNLENSSSPPSTTSSSLSDKGVNTDHANTSKRFEDGDPIIINEPLLNRNSMLFQLIACGGSLSFRGKSVPEARQQQQQQPPTAARRSYCSDLHKGVLCKSVINHKKTAAAAAAEGEDDEIKCMSENPRLWNLQAEEKEYFSGSIAESISTEGRAQLEPASLKKSSSYNEERGSKFAIGEAAVVMDEVEVKRAKASSSKCIPRMKSCSKQSKK